MLKIILYWSLFFLLGNDCLAASQERSLLQVTVENIEKDDIAVLPKYLSFASGKKYKKEDFVVLVGQEIKMDDQQEAQNKAILSVEISGDEGEIEIPLALYSVITKLSTQNLQELKKGNTPKIDRVLPDWYLYSVKIKSGSFIRFDDMDFEWSFDGEDWHEAKLLDEVIN